mgnify:CR=1 FL=1
MKKLVLPMLAVMLALLMVPVNAEVLQNEKIPVDEVMQSPCTGEEVYLTGVIHLVYAATADGAGGYHLKVHENGMLTGEAASGQKYKLNIVYNVNQNVGPGEVLTYVVREQLKADGNAADDDLWIKYTVHVTVNANGEVTSERYDYEMECK